MSFYFNEINNLVFQSQTYESNIYFIPLVSKHF